MQSYQLAREAEESLLNKIVSALTGAKDIGSKNSKKKLSKNFCVEETLAPADFKVTVKGVGKLSFPLSKAYVQKLINVSTNAKFGMGEKTVLDKNVRDTQMIESKKLNVNINQDALSRITNSMKKALQLPADSTLTPNLHNMLIYGPGQFFNKHRDSEKLQNMVATLVIVLPSPHVGGDLIIEHGRKRHTFSTESVDEVNAKCICFYCDCLHKVNKVKSGYRVALTFNVVLETAELTDTACTNKELKAAVLEYFNTSVEGDKIVFFLNHTYSEHSLRWNLLKGEDCQYASSFRSVARELDLDVHLVLANIRQCWSSADEYRPKPDWLVESESTLYYWVDANNVKLSCEYSTKRREICFARETHYSNFDPTEAEFSGPTGNEGSTVDYWYKRAAVVLLQKSNAVRLKFELNYNEAMTELCTLISVPGNEKKVREIVSKADELLHEDTPTINNFEKFVNIALYVKKKKRAEAILSPFHPNVLIPKNVEMLVQLQQQYGIDWLIELMESLRQGKRVDYYSLDSSMASEVINPFVCKFLNSGGDRSVMEFLVKAEVTTFIERSAKWNTSYHCGRTEDLERPQELFKACAAIGDAALQEKLAQYLCSQPKLFLRNELVKLYHLLQSTLTPESSENFEPLGVCLGEVVKRELPPQAQDAKAWSISAVLSCNCEHCNVLTDFLRSKTDVSKSWPANGNIRKHIMSILKDSKAPVDVTIDRKTKPFTMVLSKNATLHVEAAGNSTELKTMPEKLQPKTSPKKRQSLRKSDDKKRQKL